MFPVRDHHFGTVAKNADIFYEFQFTNRYQEDVVIRSVRSSCGCVTPSVSQQRLKSHETASILAKYNTDRFVGNRSATITVTFERPYFAEVQLKASGFIRGDVLLEPGRVDFGSGADFREVRKTIGVDYRGGATNWQIVDVVSTFPSVRVAMQETQRQRGRVSYNLTVRLLPELEAGRHQSDLILVTNDPSNREIPVTVSVNVLEPLQVSPGYFDLGNMQPGQQITKHVLVRSTEECLITSVVGDTTNLAATKSEGAKRLHRIPVVFTAHSNPGPVTARLTIQTDGGAKETVEFQANVTSAFGEILD